MNRINLNDKRACRLCGERTWALTNRLICEDEAACDRRRRAADYHLVARQATAARERRARETRTA